MSQGDVLETLARFPKSLPIGSQDAWLASPDDVVAVLTAHGFEEYRREIVRCRRDRRPLGGVWQGLQPSTGRVGSVIWVNRGESRPAVVFVDLDDEAMREPAKTSSAWWDDVDGAVLECLNDGASLAPVDIGRRLGISEEATTSVIGMLAQEGKLRISLVSSVGDDLAERSIRCPVRGHDVTVQFRETHVGRTPIAVTWCTAFDPPTAVTCESGCLKLVTRAADAVT